jgi:hypothetical protein
LNLFKKRWDSYLSRIHTWMEFIPVGFMSRPSWIGYELYRILVESTPASLMAPKAPKNLNFCLKSEKVTFKNPFFLVHNFLDFRGSESRGRGRGRGPQKTRGIPRVEGRGRGPRAALPQSKHFLLILTKN